MSDDKPAKRSAASSASDPAADPAADVKSPARTVGARRADATRMPGTSVHTALANEIGLRIVRGDYPPGTILPNEAKWADTFSVSRSAVRRRSRC